MSESIRIAFFGSSLLSSYWNGAATYYRGLVRALHRRGHRVTFFEPDAFERQQWRDMDVPDWASVVIYPGTDAGAAQALEQARRADVVVKASGLGVGDAFLEREVLALRSGARQVIFWDVDAPATLERVQNNADDPFRALIPRYDLVFTYGGGPRVVDAYRQLGARDCVPIYNALDPESHHPAAPRTRFAADLGFLGNRLPDREARVHEFFFNAARQLPTRRFVLGGAGWNDPLPKNVHWLGHVSTNDHNAFNCSARLVLNINRDSMARFGWSPPTRVFEAAGAGACLIVDRWDGIEAFLEPQREVLVASDGTDVAQFVDSIDVAHARRIGIAARARLLAQHTYSQRAAQVERCLQGRLLAAA